MCTGYLEWRILYPCRGPSEKQQTGANHVLRLSSLGEHQSRPNSNTTETFVVDSTAHSIRPDTPMYTLYMLYMN